MFKKNLFCLLVCLSTLFVAGCSSNESKTKKDDTTVIQVGDVDVAKEGYEIINSINGITFEIRSQDFDAVENYNVFDYSLCGASNTLVDYSSSKAGKVFIQGDRVGQVHSTDNAFLLYNPDKSIYYANKGKVFDVSVSSFQNTNFAVQNILPLLEDMGVSNIIIDTNNILFKKDNKTGEYSFKATLLFEDSNFALYNADLYIWENLDSQNVFMIASCNNSITDDEKSYIINSVKVTDNYSSGVDRYESKDICIDYNGLVINSVGSRALGFNDKISAPYNYSTLDSPYNELSLNTYNSYYPFMTKLSVYTLDVPATNKDLIDTTMYKSVLYYTDSRYSNGLEYKDAEYYELYDKDSNLWSVYIYKKQDWENDKLYSYFDISSIYVSVRNDKCLVFQTWSDYKNFEFYKIKTDEFITNLYTTNGTSIVPAPIEAMTEDYYDFYGYPDTEVEISTPSDATISSPTDAVINLDF